MLYLLNYTILGSCFYGYIYFQKRHYFGMRKIVRKRNCINNPINQKLFLYPPSMVTVFY